MLQRCYLSGIAPTTRNAYAAGQKQYKTFCSNANRTLIPTSESTLLLFVAHLTTLNLSHATIKVYLSAVRHLHVTAGQHSIFTQQLTPRLQQVLKGIQKTQSASQPPRVRLPITLSILQHIKHLLLQKPPSYDNTLIWAACCLAFFGFLRVSEFTVPAQSQYDHTTHLSISDISIDNKDCPQLLRIRIKQSKTDPFRQGVDIYLGRTGEVLCPVRGILPYLAQRGNRPGPLFVYQDGRMLTRHLFSTAVDKLLTELHMDKRLYNTHSFRIGAATSAIQANIPEVHVQMLGRWKSQAYKRYVRTSPQELAHLSTQLAAGGPSLKDSKSNLGNIADVTA